MKRCAEQSLRCVIVWLSAIWNIATDGPLGERRLREHEAVPPRG